MEDSTDTVQLQSTSNKDKVDDSSDKNEESTPNSHEQQSTEEQDSASQDVSEAYEADEANPEVGEVEESNIQDEEDEEEEDEGMSEEVFSSLSTFATSLLNELATPVEPMSETERQPTSLNHEQKDITDILKLFQELITYNNCDMDISYGLSSLDESGKLAVTSHLLSAVVTTLDGQQLKRLASRMVSDTCVWLSRLFRYFDSTAYIHDDMREGVIRVGRMLLHTRYPKYASDGYEALYARPPIIYTTSSARPGLPQHIANMLGVGASCLRIVPCNNVVGSSVAMDTAALDRMMTEDLAAQKKPFLVVANAGGGLVGGVDPVLRIQELCHKHEAWLHVEGHSLAALTLPNNPNLPAKVGDSMTLPLSSWFGIPSLPFVTLYRACDPSAVHAAGLTLLSLQVRLACLPLWTTIQHLGVLGITSRIEHAFKLSQYLQINLATIPHLRLLSPAPANIESVISIQDLITKPVSTAQLLETVCGSIVFQYVDDNTREGRNPEYYDNLNSWLGQVVRREVESVPLELVQLESAGLVLRWCVLETPGTHLITMNDVEQLLHSLHHQIRILDATVKQKKTFNELVNSADNLELAIIPMWAGLGGVRYIPDILIGETSLSPGAKEDVNLLNAHLVNLLKATDSAFSIGEGEDGMNCVRFGMVTSDTNISELLSLVLSTGKEIESSSKFLDEMTEVVKKGIETATEDLKRENDERLWQEGILRHVPLVGSVYNWLSPPPPPGIKGRTLDLTAGVLESTENIYRYHMQIRHGTTASSPETKLPPAPSVVTSVTPSTTSPTHSRTSSNTSSALPVESHAPSIDHPSTVQEVESDSTNVEHTDRSIVEGTDQVIVTPNANGVAVTG